MATFLNILLTVVTVCASLFVLSLVVYFFNIDMKLTTALESLLEKVYDHRKRIRKI